MEHNPPLTDPARSEWVKYQLRLRSLSMADISRSLGLYRNVASKVFSARYPMIEARIAELLGVTPQEIWPERYQAGKPIRFRKGRPALERSRHVATDSTRASKPLKKRTR